MNDAHLTLTFSMSPADSLDTLEAALAIARRGGLHLSGMQVLASASEVAPCDHVCLQLRAAEADRLELFVARLRNLFCAKNVVVLTLQPESRDADDTEQTQHARTEHGESVCHHAAG